VSSLKDVWNQKPNDDQIPWEQWLSEIEALSEQLEIETPAEEELEQHHSQGKTPLEVLNDQENSS